MGCLCLVVRVSSAKSCWGRFLILTSILGLAYVASRSIVICQGRATTQRETLAARRLVGVLQPGDWLGGTALDFLVAELAGIPSRSSGVVGSDRSRKLAGMAR